MKPGRVQLTTYNRYLNLFNKLKSKLESRGEQTYVQAVMTFDEFKHVYSQARKKLLNDKKAGKINSVGDVVQKITYNLVYGGSSPRLGRPGKWIKPKPIVKTARGKEDRWRILYRSYLEQFERSASYIRRRGYDTVSPLNFVRFVNTYKALRADLQKAVENKLIKSVGSVTKKLISRMLYKRTYRQAIAVKQAIARENLERQKGGLEPIKFDMLKYRMKDDEELTPFWEKVDARYAELRASGRSGKEAKAIIGREFFGS